jgi:hypothetical protein
MSIHDNKMIHEQHLPIFLPSPLRLDVTQVTRVHDESAIHNENKKISDSPSQERSDII